MTPAVLAQVRLVYDRDPSMFAPAGPYAQRIAMLGWGMIITAAVVFTVVLVLLIGGLLRRRNVPPGPVAMPSASAERWVLGGGMLMPIVVLAGVFLATLGTLRAEGHHGERPAVRIEVIGHQWWWEVRYPDAGVVTADELHIPVGVPVELTLRTADVIHSFWLPQLNGKTDLIPGQENHMYIEASEPGTFRGECAEFCGQQHANMAFSVVAESRGAYDAWAAREQGEAHPPLDSVQAAGMLAFTSHACAYCHTIRGTSAGGRVGPDLTHVGSRATLAGGMLANTPAALGGWIENPDRLKPGTRMPAVPLDGASVNAIVQYLESLK